MTAAPKAASWAREAKQLLDLLYWSSGPCDENLALIEVAFLAAERRAKEDAAHLAEQFGSHILHIYARGPSDPPGNQYVPLTGQHVADAIRRSISPGGE